MTSTAVLTTVMSYCQNSWLVG